MVIALENHCFNYNKAHNGKDPEKYKTTHLPEIKRILAIIEGVDLAFEEFQKLP